MKLLFSHANGYPPESYRVLLRALEDERFTRVACHAHRPLLSTETAPLFFSWHILADDLIERIQSDSLKPVWLVGHSMGAIIGILAASRRADLFRGVIAIDPVLIPTNAWFWSRIMMRLKPNAAPIVQKALARPHWFDDENSAFAFYREKRVFAGLSDEVLKDYIFAAHFKDGSGGIRLTYSGDWEACMYRSLPRISPALKKLRCPSLIIAGEQSLVLTKDRLKWALDVNPEIKKQIIPGGHLLPLESPETCAREALNFILNS